MKKALLLILTIAPLCLICQATDYIYCINNAAIGEFNIAKIHIPTGVMTEIETISNSISTMNSACVNVETEDFYFCNGYSINVFDTQTETLEAPIVLPLAANSSYHQIQYNPCDSSFYGIVAQSGFTGFSFERFNLATMEFENISSLPTDYFSCGNCISALDPSNNIFVSDHGGISGLDLSSGEEVIDTSPINPSGFAFGHISYKCITGEFFGTLANVDEETKQMGSVDLNSGLVSSVSDANWTIGFWKPYGGGNVIDQESGVYYYSGAGGLLIGASTLTGELVYSEDVSNGEIFMLQHFSQCACPDAVGIDDILVPTLGLKVYPNPVKDRLTISTDYKGQVRYSLRDVLGRSMLIGEFSEKLSIDLRLFDKGVYHCNFQDNKGAQQIVKVIKE